MTKEELFAQGWNLIYSGPCFISAWGQHMVSLYHDVGRRVSGYGVDELEALNDAVLTIQKPLEKSNELH